MSPLKLVIFDLDDTLVDTSGQSGRSDRELSRLALLPGAADLLAAIRSRRIRSAIVSTGERSLQQEKIRLLGLQDLVDIVLLCALPDEKRELFQECFRKFAARPSETLIVGDRIDREIRLGNSLGCVTVRVMSGRHRQMVPADENETATFTIANVSALQLWFGPWLAKPCP